MRPVERNELVQVRGEVHGLTRSRDPPQEQRLGDRVTQRRGGLDDRGHSKAMTAIPAATWIAPSKSSTPSTTCPFVVT